MGARSWLRKVFRRAPSKPAPPTTGRHRAGPEAPPFRIEDYLPPPVEIPEPPGPPGGGGILFSRMPERRELLGADPPGGYLGLEVATAGNADAILAEQLESAYRFQQGHYDPGSDRFENQVARLQRLGMNVNTAWYEGRRGRRYLIAVDYVEWFYYHAKRSL